MKLSIAVCTIGWFPQALKGLIVSSHKLETSHDEACLGRVLIRVRRKCNSMCFPETSRSGGGDVNASCIRGKRLMTMVPLEVCFAVAQVIQTASHSTKKLQNSLSFIEGLKLKTSNKKKAGKKHLDAWMKQLLLRTCTRT